MSVVLSESLISIPHLLLVLFGVISADISLGRAYKACYEIDSHYQRNEIADFFSYFAEGFKFEIFFNYHTLEYAISMPKLLYFIVAIRANLVQTQILLYKKRTIATFLLKLSRLHLETTVLHRYETLKT